MSLRTFMDGLEPNFHKGGKYEKYYAIYEMVDTIFYTPGKTTVGQSHVRDAVDMKRVMTTYQAVYADARLPRSLPMRLALAGFSSISAEGFVVLNTSFGEDTYARQSAGFATSIMDSSSEFSSQEQAAWLEDQQELARTGGFFFSLNRYLISAHR